MTRCKACPATWTGTGIAHCAECHETFTTVSNFDRHRAGSKDKSRSVGECSPPTAVGLLLNKHGKWSMPGRDETSLA